MMEIVQTNRNNGGRPKKAEKYSEFIGVRCSIAEKKILREKAKDAFLTLSEFLRETALQSQPVRKIKQLPIEVLQLTATLNHLAANMNQVAKKRNQSDELNDHEREALTLLAQEIKEIAAGIKKSIR